MHLNVGCVNNTVEEVITITEICDNGLFWPQYYSLLSCGAV